MSFPLPKAPKTNQNTIPPKFTPGKPTSLLGFLCRSFVHNSCTRKSLPSRDDAIP